MAASIRVVVTERPPEEIKGDVMVGIHGAEETKVLEGSLAPMRAWLREDVESFLGRHADDLRWFDTQGSAAPRALLGAAQLEPEPPGLGGEWGSRTKAEGLRWQGHDIRGLGAEIERACHRVGCKHLVMAAWPEGVDVADLIEGILLRAYSPRGTSTVGRVHICVPKGEKKVMGAEISRRVELVRAQNLARALADTCGEDGTPEALAGRCRGLHEQISVRILDQEALEALDMGLHLAVAAGGLPPCTAVLEYDGRQGDAGPTFVLVGKGVTHDTGGYNLKPSQGMYRLTYDKAGACAVIGALVAVANLGLPVRLVGVTPFAENVLDGRSYKPGDVITGYAGMTIFIEDTDAEGRLLLADAMAWAQDEYDPDVLVDIGTLTGAAGGALGEAYAPVFSNDDRVAAAIVRASHLCDERVWPMPIHELHERELGHHKADMRNSAGLHGASCVAAAFLRRFATVPWAHIDMAGKEMWEGPRDYFGEGASGFGTRLLVNLVEQLLADEEAS